MSYPAPSNVVRSSQIENDDVITLDRLDLDFQGWAATQRDLPDGAVTDADVLAWVEGPLRRFLHFEKFISTYGSLSGGRIQARSLISSGHAPELIAGLASSFELKSRGCFAWWVVTRKAFILDKSGATDQAGASILPTKREFEELDRFSLGVIAALGVVGPFVNAGTYISFSGVSKKQPKRKGCTGRIRNGWSHYYER